MERDFTSEVEELIMDMLDCYETYLMVTNIQDYGVSEYDGMLYDWLDLEYRMQNIEAYRIYMIEEMGYTRDRVTSVFENVRSYDADYINTIQDNSDAFFDSYLESMNGLLETIRVSPAGAPYTSPEVYALSARPQLGQYGSMSSTCGGIFNSPGLFSSGLAAAGSGPLGDAYNALQDADALNELLAKPASEIKPWEVAAFSMMLDDCINDNGTVDCEALTEMVNMLYNVDRVDTQGWFYEPYSESVHVEASDMLSLLNAYRTTQASQMAYRFENNDYRLTFDYDIEAVQGYCFVTDVIYGLDTYCSEYNISYTYKEDGTDPNFSIPINITASDNDSILHVSFCGDDDYNITIYRFTQNFYQDVLTADADSALYEIQDEDTELLVNSAQFTLEQIAGLIPYLDQVNNLYGLVTGAYDLYDSYNQTVANNEHCYWQASIDELQSVAGISGCSGSVVQCGNTYSINNMAINQTGVVTQVALYNAACEGNYTNSYGTPFNGTPISDYTVVMQEFNSYISGQVALDDCPALNSLIDFNGGLLLYSGGSVGYYDHLVAEELEALGAESENLEQNYLSDIESVSHDAAVEWLDNEGK